MKAILTYHSIDASGSAISTPPDVFRRHAAWLAASGVPVVSVGTLLAAPPDADAVALTFDDGFENFASEAWPVLRDAGLAATVFVVTGHVGRTSDWDSYGTDVPPLPLLDWPALGRLADDGLELGGHTHTHRDLRALDRGELVEEIGSCQQRIRSETGVEPHGMAFPYGWYDDHALEIAREHTEWACTTELRPVETADDVHCLPRLDMYYYQRPGALESWGTPRFRWRLRWRQVARTVRRRLASATP